MSHAEPGATNPADGSALPPVEHATPDAVKAAIARGREAQPDWARRSVRERGALLLQVGQLILEQQQAICELLAQETGRTATECRMTEVSSTVDYIKGVLRAGKKALEPERIKLSPLDFPGKKVVVEPVPRGVIGIIAPWNYPLSNFYKSLWPALLAGNAVVMKPSEHTPRSGQWLAERCQEVLPSGLVSVVQGKGDVGAAVLGGVDSVVFTGSVPTGRRVAQAAAERLIPASLELGGKDAAIVLADCDLDRTAVGLVQWSMHNAGQNCAGVERIYVEQSIADQLVARLGAIADRLVVASGDDTPADLGPLQNPAQLDIVERHVADAVAKGAVVVAGGERVGSGYGYRPTVLDKCSDEMLVVAEETFGPVVAVLRVKNADEAIERANASRYGLNGSVWTRNLRLGEALVRRLEVGVALVNNHSFTGILPETPWTGVKETGPGIAASRHAYHGFVRPRTVLVDSSKKPDPFWVPANADLEAMSFALVERGKGSFGALLKLAGLLGKRVAAIKELAQARPALPPKSAGS